jgi:hypothetical protein
MTRTLWDRWKTLARHAARIQSNIILTVLYFLAFLPLALLRRPFAGPLGGRADQWRERPPAPRDIASARRQF